MESGWRNPTKISPKKLLKNKRKRPKVQKSLRRMPKNNEQQLRLYSLPNHYRRHTYPHRRFSLIQVLVARVVAHNVCTYIEFHHSTLLVTGSRSIISRSRFEVVLDRQGK
jgi:hypothetical protein